ncbi:cellulose-binding family II [Catenulispora acidiphila DSM 44928]|uniref:Cellulose-binding family II n=1 Tax=Catenulispora acidiphila (strain DSM 44928 / JCM 14897 / NBRC 102108 / NRRL B-24433 / ID139908) TaxID=479433 RepID=C7Q381_CATAD|nr:cellulose binding domain-containing protein [Catenulispora acidiphila]ACU73817.1 cellulose-binding family II [Catenulispora acidiphila DSM 44928]
MSVHVLTRRTDRRKIVSLAASLSVVAACTLAVVVPSGAAYAADTATINGATTYQTIAGFGASEAFGEAAAVMNASSSVQQQALADLYSPTTGAGLTILRNEIGATSGNTIEPTNPGGPGATPNYLPLSQINQDMGQLWFAQQIKARYNVTNVYADAWSAPGFMKTNNSVSGGGQVCGSAGASCSSGDWRQAYSNYLVQYARDYAAAGVPLTYLGPSNEPDYSTNYDSMSMSPAQMASVVDVLGPTLRSSGLATQVTCCAATGWPKAGQYAAAIEADPTALAAVGMVGGHGYSGAPTSPLPGWTKQSWETEWSTFEGFSSAWDDGSDASGMAWAQHINQGLTGANLNAFLYWWGSTTPSENGDNEGLLEINGSSVIPTGRLWAFANYSRYIHPGAVRIGASSSNGAVNLSAYKNTDGSLAIVALNTGSGSDALTYSLANTGVANGATVTPYLTNNANQVAAQGTTTVAGGAFTATVPGRSLVTYVIPAGVVSGNTVTVTNPGSQTGKVGTAISGLQIQGTDSGSGQTLTYSASGLPAGLSISSSGLITGTPTTAGSSTVAVTATDSTGASGSAGFTWTVTGGTTTGTCHVAYTRTNEWPGGFTANVTITNTGTAAINGWTVGWSFPGDQKITNAWSATATQSGAAVSATNAAYNSTIAPGANTSFGFQGTFTANDTSPSSFTVNGAACS